MYEKALAIKIGTRYFYRFKNNRVYTAWSLAGAKLFLPTNFEERILPIINSLKKRKKTPIQVIGVESTFLIQDSRL